MSPLTGFGACAVTVMLVSYALEQRSVWWVLVFALACGASSIYGCLAGTWPFGAVEGAGRSLLCAVGCYAGLRIARSTSRDAMAGVRKTEEIHHDHKR